MGKWDSKEGGSSERVWVLQTKLDLAESHGWQFIAPRVEKKTVKWEEWSAWLAALFDGRSRWRLPLVMIGILFANGRRTVTTWLRANRLQDDYRGHYHFLQTVGRHWRDFGRRLLTLVITQVLRDQSRVLLAIDDTPTKRIGPRIQGAGIHHDPTPGPTGNEFCYGHVWVTLAVVLRHPRWGTIGLSIWSWLYVRQQDVVKLPKQFGWTFQTKLEPGTAGFCRRRVGLNVDVFSGQR